MQVAMLIGCYQSLTFTEKELGLWLVLWRKLFHMTALVGFNGNPLNIMGISHRMFNTAHLNCHLVAFYRNSRYMLFLGCISGARNKLSHSLATAYQWAAAILDNRDNIATEFTFEKPHYKPSHQHTYQFEIQQLALW